MSDTTIVVIVVLSMLLSAYVAVHVFLLLRRIRHDSKKSFEITRQLEQDWGTYSQEMSETRRSMLERVELLEGETRERVARFQEIATGTRDRLMQLESYLKQFFETELKAVFESFDKTVASILEEMKSELLRGVERIEEIQAVVDSKSYAQDRIMDGEGSVYRLVSEGGQAQEGAAGPPAGEEEITVLESAEEPPAEEPEDEKLRLEPEENRGTE